MREIIRVLHDNILFRYFPLFFLLCSQSSLTAQTVSLTVELEKWNYLICEDIYYLMQLTNNTNLAQAINYPYLTTGAFRFWITDNTGRVYKYWGRSNGKGTISLEAGKSIYTENSLFWYADPDEENKAYQYFRPGTYTAQAVHTPFSDSKDTIVSEVLHFTVSEPGGDEIMPFKLYRESHRLSWLMKENYNEIVHKLTTIIEKYPSSIYRPVAFEFLSYAHRRNGDSLKAESIAKTLIATYPNSIVAGIAAQDLALKMSPKEKREFYERLQTQYPATRLSRLSQVRIRGLSDQK